MRRGITLIEVLVVLGIIATLLAIGFPIYRSVHHKAQVDRSRGLIQSLAIAITSYQMNSIPLYIDDDGDGVSQKVICRAWDVDQDGILDGDIPLRRYWASPPAIGSINGAATRESLLYRGFLRSVQPEIAKSSVDTTSGRVIDSWKRPIRIAWASKVYGNVAFGLWSIGPDGVDSSTASGDDVLSWNNQ